VVGYSELAKLGLAAPGRAAACGIRGARRPENGLARDAPATVDAPLGLGALGTVS
jgi:hypothetical protein